MKRGVLPALLGAAALLVAGCADDCEKACGKLDFCNQLLTMDVFGCVDACDRADGGAVTPCAECLDGTSCHGIAGGGCGTACETFER